MNDNDLIMDQLIQEVRNYPALYDTNHCDYMNIKVKLNIWNDIAAKTSFKSGIMAKNTWLKLRNCHRDAIRRQTKMRRKMGSNCSSVKDWRYQKQMEFLVPFMFNRRTLTKIGGDPIKEDDLSELTEAFDANNKLFKPDANYHEDFRTEIGYQEEIEDKEDGDYIDAGGFLNLQQESIDSKKEEIDLNQDPLYHFFMSMYASTKRMPPQSQHKVRLQVFTAVSNEEAELFNIST